MAWTGKQVLRTVSLVMSEGSWRLALKLALQQLMAKKKNYANQGNGLQSILPSVQIFSRNNLLTPCRPCGLAQLESSPQRSHAVQQARAMAWCRGGQLETEEGEDGDSFLQGKTQGRWGSHTLEWVSGHSLGKLRYLLDPQFLHLSDGLQLDSSHELNYIALVQSIKQRTGN